MHALLMRHAGAPVCAALLRAFGTACAELPLIATPEAARRRGHCAVLMAELQRRLVGWKVRRLTLPAAVAAEGMWRESYGFVALSSLQLRLARAQLRLLVFPGATLLHKELGAEGSSK
jgi:N-acetylglutamate synthase-like GNAT family acetyltransferase